MKKQNLGILAVIFLASNVQGADRNHDNYELIPFGSQNAYRERLGGYAKELLNIQGEPEVFAARAILKKEMEKVWTFEQWDNFRKIAESGNQDENFQLLWDTFENIYFKKMQSDLGIKEEDLTKSEEVRRTINKKLDGYLSRLNVLRDLNPDPERKAPEFVKKIARLAGRRASSDEELKVAKDWLKNELANATIDARKKADYNERLRLIDQVSRERETRVLHSKAGGGQQAIEFVNKLQGTGTIFIPGVSASPDRKELLAALENPLKLAAAKDFIADAKGLFDKKRKEEVKRLIALREMESLAFTKAVGEEAKAKADPEPAKVDLFAPYVGPSAGSAGVSDQRETEIRNKVREKLVGLLDAASNPEGLSKKMHELAGTPGLEKFVNASDLPALKAAYETSLLPTEELATLVKDNYHQLMPFSEGANPKRIAAVEELKQRASALGLDEEQNSVDSAVKQRLAILPGLDTVRSELEGLAAAIAPVDRLKARKIRTALENAREKTPIALEKGVSSDRNTSGSTVDSAGTGTQSTTEVQKHINLGPTRASGSSITPAIIAGTTPPTATPVAPRRVLGYQPDGGNILSFEVRKQDGEDSVWVEKNGKSSWARLSYKDVPKGAKTSLASIASQGRRYQALTINGHLYVKTRNGYHLYGFYDLARGTAFGD